VVFKPVPLLHALLHDARPAAWSRTSSFPLRLHTSPAARSTTSRSAAGIQYGLKLNEYELVAPKDGQCKDEADLLPALPWILEPGCASSPGVRSAREHKLPARASPTLERGFSLPHQVERAATRLEEKAAGQADGL